jgi:DNA polymerase-3 subunit gamma/tau
MKKTGEESALYRKYRPADFKDVIGQGHVVTVLEQSIKNGTLAHAYLFAGSRGTGKTSVARIFAREIGTSANDLYEMDAASNRGIDDIREIRDGVSTVPFESKYKVYIIDEVHMLTKEAFNALLKTLEEPPAHAIFILATTELDKLPETVISRCQTFTFKKPNQVILRDFASAVAKKEGFTLEPAAADLVAILGDGSFRDTQGILQKVIGISKDKKISREEVEAVTGAPRSSLVSDCLDGIVNKDFEKALAALQGAAEQNIDMKIFAKLLIEKLRFALLLRVTSGEGGGTAGKGSMEEMIGERVSEDDLKKLKAIAAQKDANISGAVLLELLTAYEHIGRAYIAELPLELALMKIIGAEK